MVSSEFVTTLHTFQLHYFPPKRKLSLARHILPQFIVAPDPNVGEICAERSRHTLRVDLGEQCSLSTRACKKNLYV